MDLCDSGSLRQRTFAIADLNPNHVCCNNNSNNMSGFIHVEKLVDKNNFITSSYLFAVSVKMPKLTRPFRSVFSGWGAGFNWNINNKYEHQVHGVRIESLKFWQHVDRSWAFKCTKVDFFLHFFGKYRKLRKIQPVSNSYHMLFACKV